MSCSTHFQLAPLHWGWQLHHPCQPVSSYHPAVGDVQWWQWDRRSTTVSRSMVSLCLGSVWSLVCKCLGHRTLQRNIPSFEMHTVFLPNLKGLRTEVQQALNDLFNTANTNTEWHILQPLPKTSGPNDILKRTERCPFIKPINKNTFLIYM